MMSPYTPPPQMPLDIVYRDEALLAVNKPSGLLSVPGRGPEKADCMIARVQAEFETARIVHRLDMETSGLLLLALSDDMQRRLSIMFEKRLLEKAYMALVAGIVADDSGIVDLPLAKDWPNRPLQKVDHDAGKPSETYWSVVERGHDITRVQLKPLTGRTHQLRVHMNAIGHPILGDTLYGTDCSRTAAPTLALHASALAFKHPITTERLELVSAPVF